MKIGQLTDQEVDNDYKDAIAGNGWEVYIPVTEITINDQKKEERIKKFQSAEKINLYIDATNLTVCF